MAQWGAARAAGLLNPENRGFDLLAELAAAGAPLAWALGNAALKPVAEVHRPLPLNGFRLPAALFLRERICPPVLVGVAFSVVGAILLT